MKRSLRASAVLVFSALLTACVTTTTGPFTEKVSEKKALESYIALGYGYLADGKVALAKQRTERALEIDPNNAEAHTVMAMIWQQEGELELAEKHFEKALSERDDIAKTNHLYGEFLMSQGKYLQAITSLKRVSLELDYPDRPKTYQDLGLCYLQTQQPELALTAFKKAQRLDPSMPEPHYQAANLAFEKGEFEYAIKSFDAFRRLVATGKARHSAETVYLGIRLARHLKDRKAETAYVKMLYRDYRATPQFQAFMDGYKPFLR